MSLDTLYTMRREGADRRSAPLPELSRVVLLREVLDDGGVVVPAGSTGTVVAVWHGGEGYDVEFTMPRPVLVTVDAGSIGPHRE